MIKSYVSILLLVSIGSAFGMESTNSSNESSRPKTPKGLTALAFSNFHSNVNSTDSRKFNIKRFIYKPDDAEKKLLTQSLANAPTEVHTKIYEEKYLPSTPRSNFLFLTGNPGMGKTTLANAIAMALTSDGGSIYCISSGDLSREHRNATSAFLNQLMTEISSSQEKSVLVINELNKILENHASEHTDTGDTAATLWQNLDKNMSNLNFFFIGTANDTKKIPIQLQDRFLIDFVKITTPQEEARLKQIQRFISELNIPKDDFITNAYLKDIAKRTSALSHRRIEQLCQQARKCAIDTEIKKHNGNFSLVKPILTKECFESASKKILNNLQEFCNFSTQITDEERRHQESRKDSQEHLEQAKKFHDQSQELSKKQFQENQTFQEKQIKYNSDVQTRLAIHNMAITSHQAIMTPEIEEFIRGRMDLDYYKTFKPDILQVEHDEERKKENSKKNEPSTTKKGWFW